MADYEMEKDVYELNFESARLAKEACEEATAKDPSQPRFVMGSLGPTNRTGSISPVIPTRHALMCCCCSRYAFGKSGGGVSGA